MPVPLDTVYQNLSKLQFISHGIKLPHQWPGWDKHYQKAFAQNEMSVTVQPLSPSTAGFLASSVNAYHAATQKKISELHFNFMDGISQAIIGAWKQFHQLATFSGVVVNGPIATGGTMAGPNLQPLITALAPQSTKMNQLYSKVIAQAIGENFQQFIATIKVPGLPWYPSFAAFPGPMSPPTPNIPAPLATLTNVPAMISQSVLGKKMVALLNQAKALHHMELFDGVAAAFEKCVNMWLATTMVTNVLATGAVPTFAPPVVPAGPVVGGVGNSTPGGLV
jgi:hypothetical protein